MDALDELLNSSTDDQAPTNVSHRASESSFSQDKGSDSEGVTLKKAQLRYFISALDKEKQLAQATSTANIKKTSIDYKEELKVIHTFEAN